MGSEKLGMCDKGFVQGYHFGEHAQRASCVNWREQPQGEATRRQFGAFIHDSICAVFTLDNKTQHSCDCGHAVPAQTEGGEKPHVHCWEGDDPHRCSLCCQCSAKFKPSSPPATAGTGDDGLAKRLTQDICNLFDSESIATWQETKDAVAELILPWLQERSWLLALLERISTDVAQTTIEDPIRAADGWVMMSKPVLEDIKKALQ